MKPNELKEGCEIAQEDLISQLGVLILEGRTPLDVKSNIRDCVNCDDGLLHHRKEDFLSLWKSCPAMYIEVWLCHHEQFNEKEAMNGHSGYLMIEQWQIEIELNRSSEHSFHCTGKMLIQAIKSKLYFSQLSAWLSLTRGKFPRHTYFRLCHMENKTPLKRFIRAPDFHQFPQVNITPTKELVVSLHSLPHSNIPQDYPMFLWVLADIPTETPQRKSTEKLKSNSEPDSLLGKDNSYYYGLSLEQDCSGDPTHVVRKLEFKNRSLVKKMVSHQQQIISEEKDVDPTHSFDTSKNINRRANVEHSLSSSDWDFSKYYTKREQPSVDSKMERNVFCETSTRKTDNLSLTSINLMASESPQSYKLLRKEGHFSGLEQKATVSKESFGKYTLGSLTKSALHSNSDTENRVNYESSEFYETDKASTMTREEIYDKGLCEIMQNAKADYDISFPCQKTYKSGTFASRTPQECDKNFIPLEKQFLSSTDNSKIFGTDFNSACSNREISRKSLLSCDLNAAKECSHKDLTSKTCKDLNCKETVVGKNRKLKNITKGSIDRERSNLESLRTRNLETKNKSWDVDKYGGILHRTSKDIRNILPEVRHVMDEEYEKKLNERLRECCLSSKGCSGVGQGLCKRKTGRTENKGLKNEDNVFSEQRCSVVPRNPSISRYHFRHASTGTLPVFHPSTGLPVSSSPAPFRKTSQKETVDDICSPSREPSSLSDPTDRISNLSKSAPTLATQSLLVNFEESVLNDRLRPDGVVEGFTAELSASGSKKCLAHVTLPVQAYFFKLSDDNAPSPYMGYISLNVPGLSRKGYHVPKKGTIQLTLFNPNQTVVKVFVVLYDFSDMQPNFQTFLRQKTTSLVKSDGLVDRIHDSLLHYLIHLRFASSKSGRIYLHTDIRVIFARHPSEQVHLRTTTSGPTNPKYVPRQATQEDEF